MILYEFGNLINFMDSFTFGFLFFSFCRKEAGLEMEGHFLVRQVYEDVKTYDLVGAASKVLSE